LFVVTIVSFVVPCIKIIEKILKYDHHFRLKTIVYTVRIVYNCLQ